MRGQYVSQEIQKLQNLLSTTALTYFWLQEKYTLVKRIESDITKHSPIIIFWVFNIPIDFVKKIEINGIVKLISIRILVIVCNHIVKIWQQGCDWYD